MTKSILADYFAPFFKEKGFKGLTQVQEKVLPIMLDGDNVICTAQTGTGKTLAYALPLVQRVKEIESDEGLLKEKGTPYVLVLSPTRELTEQIQKVFKSLSHFAKFRSRELVASMTSVDMKKLSTQSFEVLVGTPNKIKQMLSKKELKLENLKTIVFDEADELFQMGFKKDIDFILDKAPEFVQFGLFSATMGSDVEVYINEKFSGEEIKRVDLRSDAKLRPRIETFNIFCTLNEKKMMAKLFLEKTAKGRGIIFCNQINQSVELAQFLDEKTKGLKYKLIHGDMDKLEREKNLKLFRDKKIQFLVATDLVARGIDIDDMWWVLNFGLPKKAEYYFHRAGRVARGGKNGVVYNFVTDFDSKWVEVINNAIKAQTNLDIDAIAKNLKEARKKVKKKATKIVKVKETKRTKKYGLVKK